MTKAPLNSIEERLRRLPLQVADQLFGMPRPLPETLLDIRQLERTMESMVHRKDEILATFPAFHDVLEWVEVHWSGKREIQRPAGTIPRDSNVHQEVVQADSMEVASRLYLAAARYGAAEVAAHATKFASHGMVETQSNFLLRGRPPARVIELDDHTALIPYREAMSDGKLRLLASDSSGEDDFWPPDGAADVYILRTTVFENKGRWMGEAERHISPLLRCGIEPLVLLLGLVWGVGLRLFANFESIPEPVAATLPHVRSLQNGSWTQRTSLILPRFGHVPNTRPFEAGEVANLVARYAALSDQERNKAALALRRLRDSRERDDVDGMGDRAIDLAIALEAMFMEAGEAYNHKKVVSGRASWYYADSMREKDAAREQLKDFYDQRNEVVHGNSALEGNRANWDMLEEIDNIACACLKTMITDGRPGDWEASKNFKNVRQTPLRADEEIPSTKSDSLSWTVAEQREIDAALESVWRPELDNAPAPLPGAVATGYGGINPEEIDRCRREGIPFTIAVPVRLYLAHPMWPEDGDDPDERVMHYCGRDVDRHMRLWLQEASAKKMHMFELQPEPPIAFVPRVLPYWRELLHKAGL